MKKKKKQKKKKSARKPTTANGRCKKDNAKKKGTEQKALR